MTSRLIDGDVSVLDGAGIKVRFQQVAQVARDLLTGFLGLGAGCSTSARPARVPCAL
jgi:hypothetical protein